MTEIEIGRDESLLYGRVYFDRCVGTGDRPYNPHFIRLSRPLWAPVTPGDPPRYGKWDIVSITISDPPLSEMEVGTEGKLRVELDDGTIYSGDVAITGSKTASSALRSNTMVVDFVGPMTDHSEAEGEEQYLPNRIQHIHDLTHMEGEPHGFLFEIGMICHDLGAHTIDEETAETEVPLLVCPECEHEWPVESEVESCVHCDAKQAVIDKLAESLRRIYKYSEETEECDASGVTMRAELKKLCKREARKAGIDIEGKGSSQQGDNLATAEEHRLFVEFLKSKGVKM